MTAPVGREAIERLADAALERAGRSAAGVEVVVQHAAGGLTRFANSQIHQNVATADLSVAVRVVTGDGRVGVAAAHTDDPATVADTVDRALEIARVSPPDPEFPGLAPPAGHAEVPVDDATLGMSPGGRAAVVRGLLDEVPPDFEAAGAFSTDLSELGVFTTAGQRAYSAVTSVQLSAVVTGPSSSGYAEQGGRALTEIDPAAAGRVASAKARAGASPVELGPGSWPVVLEPAATGTLVQFLAYLGFGGRDHLEGRAFTAGRLGERVVDEQVTIADDALARETVGLPFDWEGTPKRRVMLVGEGVAVAVVHDRHTARRSGVASTGHGLPAPNPYGPLPVNPIMAPGDGGSVADLVAGLERGLLVTRLHYTNVVHPLETSITGMTRDGTFLVEDGRVVRAVCNLRFTQSILAALASVEAVSTETAYASELFFGGSRFPAVRLPAFEFTSSTTYG